MSEEKIITTGTVTKVEKSNLLWVKLDKGGKTVLGYRAGKMIKNHISLVPGDRVDVEFSPYSFDKCRVIYRLKDL